MGRGGGGGRERKVSREVEKEGENAAHCETPVVLELILQGYIKRDRGTQ